MLDYYGLYVFTQDVVKIHYFESLEVNFTDTEMVVVDSNFKTLFQYPSKVRRF